MIIHGQNVILKCEVDVYFNQLSLIVHETATCLLIVEVLLHHERLVPLTVDVAVAVLVLESLPGRYTPLHCTTLHTRPTEVISHFSVEWLLVHADRVFTDKDGPGPLAHPLVLDLRDLGVGVAHHGDQQVQ